MRDLIKSIEKKGAVLLLLLLLFVGQAFATKVRTRLPQVNQTSQTFSARHNIRKVASFSSNHAALQRTIIRTEPCKAQYEQAVWRYQLLVHSGYCSYVQNLEPPVRNPAFFQLTLFRSQDDSHHEIISRG